MRSVDNVNGVNKALHDYNNAKVRGNKQDMRKALMAATVEFSDYENKANKSKIKREINGLLRENGMKALDKAMETISQNEKFDKARLSIAIREKINEENEAINSYMSLVPHIVDTEIKGIIEDIANEEKVHVGELQEILYSLDPDELTKEKEGRKENAL